MRILSSAIKIKRGLGFPLLTYWGSSLNFSLPPVLGQSAQLGCQYSLANSSLYSVKWYKNGQEFFRYMPSMARTFEVFHVSGVSLDVS